MPHPNRRIILDAIPEDALGEHHFRAEDATAGEPGAGQLLVRVGPDPGPDPDQVQPATAG